MHKKYRRLFLVSLSLFIPTVILVLAHLFAKEFAPILTMDNTPPLVFIKPIIEVLTKVDNVTGQFFEIEFWISLISGIFTYILRDK